MSLSYALARGPFARSMTRGTTSVLAGDEHLVSGGAVLVCNHWSDADPAILLRTLPVEVGFLAAPFMGRLPVFRTLLRRAGSVAIGAERPEPWREQVRARLVGGHKLVVFPEGQAWIRGQDFDAPMAPFHPGFAAFAYEAAVPVVPMVIVGLQSHVESFRTSPLVRRMAGDPEELRQTREVLRYDRCRVQVLRPLAADRFAGMSKEEAVPWLIAEARAQMERALQAASVAPS
ncbi:MAG: 1-acyl-sn-glycerol-3-phosphate acyltransferase [Myxococcales bacterium]|nr:1-acyl-sn-glycerol-3-phosphate acyltransferase [Myxococcales bacterium]